MIEVNANDFLCTTAKYGDRKCHILYKYPNNTCGIILLDTFEKMLASEYDLHNIGYVFSSGKEL